MSPTWQARLFAAGIRALIRREDWGDEHALARRARRLFGAPAMYGRMRAWGLRIRPAAEPGLRGEWIEPPRDNGRIILYIHGGGFVSCSAARHRPITTQLARLSGSRVCAVDYPLAPEARYPAGLEAVLEAYRALARSIASPRHLAVAGDSAGGNLALSVLTRARDEGLPMAGAAAVFSPWLDLTGGSPSVQGNNGRCDMFRPRNLPDFARAYLGPSIPPDAWPSPLRESLAGLPPVLFQVGSSELLRDDAVLAHRKIRAEGGQSELQVFDGVFHGWQMLDGLIPEARQALRGAATFLAQ